MVLAIVVLDFFISKYTFSEQILPIFWHLAIVIFAVSSLMFFGLFADFRLIDFFRPRKKLAQKLLALIPIILGMIIVIKINLTGLMQFIPPQSVMDYGELIFAMVQFLVFILVLKMIANAINLTLLFVLSAILTPNNFMEYAKEGVAGLKRYN
jgi:hypothetical protein